MTPEEHWKKYLKLDDQLSDAELRFARAVINVQEKRATTTGPVCMADFAPLWFESLSSKAYMRSLQEEIDETLKHLDAIGFCP